MPEKWFVLTYRDYDFTDGGRQVRGRTLHCYRESHDNGWPGVEYGKLSVPCTSVAFTQIPKCNAAYEIYFDRFGKVADMKAVS